MIICDKGWSYKILPGFIIHFNGKKYPSQNKSNIDNFPYHFGLVQILNKN